ncbi:TetR/AcrR family transcriptional regulator [Streptomyces rubradiris]|uniref:TetR family transcriptional regulator n=1 Tax=Streptomyces rubradiris TaxID=285531 RepID=A0ABQ3RQU0_STRRR|nr:TetR/AcrR family transcriptional regulator [Streptomyces rubradiris]GHH24834.1 TetR family transcriptional regulator [Streptomyces rubradiris]GHI58227.1 TetR family transcriptional regulator [Streptomyces rubradiris]
MQKRAEQTRQAIVRATAELIGDDGPGAAGLVDICRGAGVSRGALYHHFATKEAVVVAVHTQARRKATALVDAAFGDALSDPLDTAAFTALSRFGSALGRALSDDLTVRAGLQLDPDGSADPARRLRQEVLSAVHRRVSGLLPPDAPGAPGPEGQDLADLAMVVVAGLESLGRTDPAWWSPGTSDRVWRTLRRLFTDPASAPDDTVTPREPGE